MATLFLYLPFIRQFKEQAQFTEQVISVQSYYQGPGGYMHPKGIRQAVAIVVSNSNQLPLCNWYMSGKIYSCGDCSVHINHPEFMIISISEDKIGLYVLVKESSCSSRAGYSVGALAEGRADRTRSGNRPGGVGVAGQAAAAARDIGYAVARIWGHGERGCLAVTSVPPLAAVNQPTKV